MTKIAMSMSKTKSSITIAAIASITSLVIAALGMSAVSVLVFADNPKTVTIVTCTSQGGGHVFSTHTFKGKNQQQQAEEFQCPNNQEKHVTTQTVK
jgi:hypothetical protein